MRRLVGAAALLVIAAILTAAGWMYITVGRPYKGYAGAEQFVDGGSRVTATQVVNPGAILLARQGTYGSRLDGSVAELIVYNRTLTDQELADLHGWLKARYGIP